ncbi:hypothetical protein CEXT_189811 [Caerostris extrusa]|uniref:Uncharacterized protein n=1 Tax=Caerostris extrusa TaxID=172846 RepID=A0AAV4MYY5_CAEEX|nr:hypothetical protein CEXT_189811 [Caerostris extrusa]
MHSIFHPQPLKDPKQSGKKSSTCRNMSIFCQVHLSMGPSSNLVDKSGRLVRTGKRSCPLKCFRTHSLFRRVQDNALPEKAMFYWKDYLIQ